MVARGSTEDAAAVATNDATAQARALIAGGVRDVPWHASDEKIFAAALELFAELGYNGTSTRMIAQRAAMSPGALYSHYASKGDILYRIIRLTHENMLREMQLTMTKQVDLISRLHDLVACHVRYHATMNVAARVANYELHCLDDERAFEITQLRQLIEGTVRDTLMLAEGAGLVRTDDVTLATVMIVTLGIDVSRWFRAGRRTSPEELAAYYADHVVTMFSAQTA